MANRPNFPFRLLFGQIVFDPITLELIDANGQPVPMRRQSLHVLRELAIRHGDTVTKDELITAVWAGRAVSDDNLVQCIKDIRSALVDTDRELLRTAVGRGYSLHGTLKTISQPGTEPRLYISRFEVDEDQSDLVETAQILFEELIVALAPRGGVNIISKAELRDTAEFVMEGRVSLLERAVRVFVQMAKTQSGDIAFAESWTAHGATATDLASAITDKIGSLLRIYMFNHAGADFVTQDNQYLDTQALMAKAAYHMSRIQMQNRDVARDAMILAMEREPENAMVLAMRASTAVLSILQECRSKLPDTPEFCLELTDRAMGLAPHIDFVNRARGSMRLWFLGDHAGARADCERALETTPAFHLAHQTIALSEILSGEYKAGIERTQRIIELGTKSNPRYPHYLAMLALGQMLSNQPEEALLSSKEANQRAPFDPWCNYVYAVAAAHSPDITESLVFRDMIDTLNLPFDHFRALAFTDPGAVDWLEERLAQVGFVGSG